MVNKIETTIIDNWLDPSLADFVSDYLYKGIYYSPGHGSVEGGTSGFLYGNMPLSPLLDYLIIKIIKIRPPIHMLRVYTNLHYSNMGGEFHEDDGDITFLYMPSKGLNPKEEGHFEIKDEGKFEYKFNRLIYFDAKKLHKGHPPKQNIPRITLAFKTSLTK